VQSIRQADESLAAEKIRAHITFAYERILQCYLNSVSQAAAAAGPATTAPPPASRRIS